jgi:hypothetical protein
LCRLVFGHIFDCGVRFGGVFRDLRLGGWGSRLDLGGPLRGWLLLDYQLGISLRRLAGPGHVLAGRSRRHRVTTVLGVYGSVDRLDDGVVLAPFLEDPDRRVDVGGWTERPAPQARHMAMSTARRRSHHRVRSIAARRSSTPPYTMSVPPGHPMQTAAYRLAGQRRDW